MFGLGQAISGLVNSFASNSQSVKEEYLDAEYDTAERRATVNLYSRVVEGLASVDRSTAGTGSAHHWVLLVHFVDDSYRYLEGNQNEDGFLHAYYRKNNDAGLTKLKELGSVRISPSRLRTIARNNALNGSRYDLVENNCQDWAVRAAKDISDDVGKAAAAIPRIAPVLAMTRNMALAAPFGGNPIIPVLTGFRF